MNLVMTALPTAALALLRGISLQSWLIQMLAVLLALSVHEAAHAWMANHLGDSSAREAGRLTLNPLAHLDPAGTLFILLGAPVGWAKPVPFNPNRFSRRYTIKQGIALVSIAGVTANVLLAMVSRLLLVGVQLLLFVLKTDVALLNNILDIAYKFLVSLFYINLYLCVFNLLPVPPLDGFKFFGTLLPSRIYYWLMQRERIIGMVFIGIVILARGLLSTVLHTLATPLIWILDTPATWLLQLLARLVR
ncbi:MAG: site-2 protease family protein [Bacillota bacterium]|nr:site-2 protease family protein [Bacillota bacterium]